MCYFQFPEDADEDEPARQETGLAPEATAPNTILVIDDHAAVREAMTEVLSITGLDVLTAQNGLEGLKIFKNQQAIIVLVLLDMGMPVMNGKETFHELRQIDPEIKVTILTSSDKAEVNQQIGENHAFEFLSKACSMDMLLDHVTMMLAA